MITFSGFKFCKSLRILTKLWPYLWSGDKKIRRKLIFSVVFNLLAVFSSIGTPVLFGYMIDFLNSSSPFIISPLWFLVLLMAYVVIWSLSKMFLYLREIMVFPVLERAVRLLTFYLFKHIQLSSFQYHLKRKTGEITETIETAIESFPSIVWYITFSFAPLILEGFFIFLIIFFICGIYYSSILVICLLFYVLVTRWGFKKVLRALREANLSHFSAISKIVDSLLNFSSIKYFHNYNYEFEKIDEVLRIRETKTSCSSIKNQVVHLYQTLILSFFFLLLMFFTGYNFISNTISLGEFVMIHTYMLQFTFPLENFGQTFQLLNRSLVKMERVLKILEEPVSYKNGSIVICEKESLHVVFENVWFGYQRNTPILKNISFELFPNQTLAIIGETGSGKSTIISLLLGFIEPSKGRILINGHNLKDIDQESFINLVGIVPQDVTLFNDTLYQNILYANVSATKKMIRDALNIAGLEKSIQKLPQGLKAIVGERGVRLSGGEKQRVGIARAVVRKPKLYVFDEATASLDSKTEKYVLKNIEYISKHASTLIVSHKLSTINFADKIILLEKGSIKYKNYDSLTKDATHL